ncbi:hypothetical protein POX_a00579 [Penicillium oxalicum]|uniref:hypothetical protein n=1 Tax=Penicillium oxalicum TaxID=69781 RepID=UPI0020B75711|nr:hypothetical protein POX_a00579 [Penicillium oxalicum]KAI2793989.1 hypothetical protein POX_a00579 [Penicillium oxalicum]
MRTRSFGIAYFLKHRKNGRPKHLIHTSSIAGQAPRLSGSNLRCVKVRHQRSGPTVEKTRPGWHSRHRSGGVIKTPLWTSHPEKPKMTDDSTDVKVTPEEVAEVMMALVRQDSVSKVIDNRSGKGRQSQVTGGTILEVSKTVREVMVFNDAGPDCRPGNTASDQAAVEEESLRLSVEEGQSEAKL